MEAPAFCRHILVNLLVLLAAQTEGGDTAQEHGAVLPEVRPDRLQFVEYDSVSVRCGGVGGSNAWRVWRKLNTAGSPEACDASSPSCTINPITEKHSGEYWCVTGEGGRSGAVDISVTADLVILDIPATPVAEGSDLTLRCIDKTKLGHIADFYKDGVYLKNGYKSHMTLQKISRSDEGRYKCSISGKGESPESRLAVGQPGEGTRLSGQTKPLLLLLLVFLAVLLLVGLILFRKCKGSTPSRFIERNLLTDHTPDQMCLYAVAVKPRQVKEPEAARVSVPMHPSEETIYSVIN